MVASTNLTSLSYIEETVAGITPVTPAFQILPTTGGSPQGNLSSVNSEVIRSDRQIDDTIIVDSDVGGNINYELSYTPFAPIIEALMQGTPSTSDDTISNDITVIGGTGFSSTTTDFTSLGLVIDSYVLVSGCVNTINNGVHRITAIATNLLSVSTLTTVNETAITSFRMTSNNTRNGVLSPKNFTFLKHIEGTSPNVYMYYRGCQISKMNMNFETGSILSGTFDILGLTETVTDTIISGQTKVAVPSYSLLNSVSSIANIEIEGLPSTTSFQSLNLSIDNSIEAAKSIGTLGAKNLSSFTFSVSADISIYFEDKTVYDNYNNSTSFKVTLTLLDGTGNYIIVRLPKCKFETLDTPIPGKDAFFMLNGSFIALRDPINNYTAQIDRLAVHV